jgi:type III HopJ-like effector protein
MTESELLATLKENADSLVFADVISVIDARYAYTPTAFSNGTVNNDAGQNGGSCKVFSFALHHQLSAEDTVKLFAEHYRKVAASPDDTDHANIRAFLQSGWKGIRFNGEALAAKG